MTPIEKIKAEIERRIKELEKTFPNRYYEGEVCGLKRLLSFIESLKKEQQVLTCEGEIVKDINNNLAITAKLPELKKIGRFGDKVIIKITRL